MDKITNKDGEIRDAFVLKRPPVLFGAAGHRYDSRLFAMGRQAKAHAHKERYRFIAKAFSFLGHTILYCILGYTAARMVQVSETFESWDVSGAKQCTVSLGNLTGQEWPSECSFANTVPKLDPTSSIANGTFSNVFYNPGCYTMNESTKILIPLVNANEGVKLCVCVKPQYLPEKSTIYWAAALFTVCNIAESLCEFFATTYDADWAATIFSIYGAIQYMVENYLGTEDDEDERKESESNSEKVVDSSEVHV